MSDDARTPTPAAAIAPLLTRDRPLMWVFSGDSVTHGSRHTFGWRDYTELFAERVRWELGRLRDAVIDTAVSGRRVTDLAADLEWSVLRHRPDVVLLMFGLNDCVGGGTLADFREGYHAVIEGIAAQDAQVILQTPNLSGPGDPERQAKLPPYLDAVREIAAAHGVPLVDHVPMWEGAIERNALEWWIAHGCHPNGYGHRALARQLLASLGLDAPPSNVLELHVPMDVHPFPPPAPGGEGNARD
jgi:lysophospholipase L1-like esterase